MTDTKDHEKIYHPIKTDDFIIKKKKPNLGRFAKKVWKKVNPQKHSTEDVSYRGLGLFSRTKRDIQI